MRRVTLRVLVVLSLLMGVFGFWGSPGQAQTALEEWAKQQISEKTGIDPDLLATLFVTEGSNQFILAFVYITEEVLESNLKSDLKQAIAPYVGRNAMLTLVLPTRPSHFDPLDITFSQGGLVFLIDPNGIHAITEDFKAGQLEANAVSAGVIELPSGIDVPRPFQIQYRTHETTFSLGGSAGPGGTGPISNLLLLFLQFIFLFFLFPFLLGI
jgi:hypothetical protein